MGGLVGAQFPSNLARSYLDSFGGSQPAAADMAGVPIPTIKKATHGEYLTDDQRLRLYTAACKRLGRTVVDNLIGLRGGAPPVAAPSVAVVAPAEQEVMHLLAKEMLTDLRGKGATITVEGEKIRFHAPTGIMSQVVRDGIEACKPELIALIRAEETAAPSLAAVPLLRCKSCGEEHPATREWFIASAGEAGGNRAQIRATCRVCWAKRAVLGGQARGRQMTGESMADTTAKPSAESAVVGQLPLSQQLMDLAARAEGLEGYAKESTRHFDDLVIAREENRELQEEIERLRGELAKVAALRANLSALLGTGAG